MILISCVENAMGLRFNRRRCSRDRAVCARILERSGNALWLAQSSAGLFREFPEAALHDAADLSQVPEGAWCFWERPAPEAVPEKLLLYLWNRDYPSDEKFVFPGGEEAWCLAEENELEGYSHPLITERVYERKERRED